MKKLLFTLLLSLSLLEAGTSIFTLTTTTGNTLNVTGTKQGLKVEEYLGKAVLITLFGHACPPCIREIPELVELTHKHRTDLEIIAIEAQNYPVEAVKNFMQEHNINYNVVAGINHTDFISYLIKAAGSNALPMIIGIDKYGEVQDVQIGLMSADELETLVNDLNE